MCAPIALEIMQYIGSGLPSVTSYFQKGWYPVLHVHVPTTTRASAIVISFSGLASLALNNNMLLNHCNLCLVCMDQSLLENPTV